MIPPGVVRLWRWDLDAGADDDRAVLSPEERARADRYAVPQGARRFVAGRAAMRRVLGGAAASELPLATGPNGKPFLPGGPEFNLSHCGPIALFAMASFPVGIDVEAERPLAEDIGHMVFTPGELAHLSALPLLGRAAAFFRGWTRKEAVVKANGGTIADLRRVVVLPEPDLPGWQVVDLLAPSGHAAALAAPCQGWSIEWVQT